MLFVVLEVSLNERNEYYRSLLEEKDAQIKLVNIKIPYMLAITNNNIHFIKIY
jgi:hypothetical protein